MGVVARLGVYEKALGACDWRDLPDRARRAGYDFVEVSVDESPERLARLATRAEERRDVRYAADAAETPIDALVLSALRRWALGSPDALVRARAGGLVRQALVLASDLGARMVQVPGYFSFHDAAGPDGRARYVDGLRGAAALAGELGVHLAVENMDGTDVASLVEATAVVEEVDAPWVGLQPDLGNLVAQGLDLLGEIGTGIAYYRGVHLKDALPGVYRRVPFGNGHVAFGVALAKLRSLGYPGPFTVEIWNDDEATAARHAAVAAAWAARQLCAVGYEGTGRVAEGSCLAST